MEFRFYVPLLPAAGASCFRSSADKQSPFLIQIDIIPLAVLVFIAQDRLAVRQRFQNPLFQ